MRALLDTCVVSEARREKGHPRVRAQVEAIRNRDLFVSVITVGELAKGIALLPGGKKKDALSEWLLALEQDYAERILPVDAETARVWGELTAAAQRRGKSVSVSDGIIAATAIRHGIHVMTRNVSDFRETGAMLINPWENS
jgi:predicted nucleic acid-binding protein